MSEENRKGSANRSGLGVLGVVQVVLVVLKLIGVIEWNWLLVFSPTLTVSAVYAFLFLLSIIVFGILRRKGRGRRK